MGRPRGDGRYRSLYTYTVVAAAQAGTRNLLTPSQILNLFNESRLGGFYVPVERFAAELISTFYLLAER